MRPSAVAVLLSAAALALAACGSSSSGTSAAPASQAPDQTSSAPGAAPSIGGAGTPAAAGVEGALKIGGFHYNPSPLTVAPGQMVSATNSDGAEHTVTSDQKGLFSGDNIAQGKTVTFKVPTKPGTYTFHCEYHARMHGTLIVK